MPPATINCQRQLNFGTLAADYHNDVPDACMSITKSDDRMCGLPPRYVHAILPPILNQEWVLELSSESHPYNKNPPNVGWSGLRAQLSRPIVETQEQWAGAILWAGTTPITPLICLPGPCLVQLTGPSKAWGPLVGRGERSRTLTKETPPPGSSHFLRYVGTPGHP